MPSKKREARKKLKKIYSQLSPEEIKKLNELVNKQAQRYVRMSPEEKAKFDKEMKFYEEKLKL